MKIITQTIHKALRCMLLLLALTLDVQAQTSADFRSALQQPTTDLQIQALSNLAYQATSEFNENSPDAYLVQNAFAQALVSVFEKRTPSNESALRNLLLKAQTSPLLRADQQTYVRTNMLTQLSSAPQNIATQAPGTVAVPVAQAQVPIVAGIVEETSTTAFNTAPAAPITQVGATPAGVTPVAPAAAATVTHVFDATPVAPAAAATVAHVSDATPVAQAIPVAPVETTPATPMTVTPQASVTGEPLMAPPAGEIQEPTPVAVAQVSVDLPSVQTQTTTQLSDLERPSLPPSINAYATDIINNATQKVQAGNLAESITDLQNLITRARNAQAEGATVDRSVQALFSTSLMQIFENQANQPAEIINQIRTLMTEAINSPLLSAEQQKFATDTMLPQLPFIKAAGVPVVTDQATGQEAIADTTAQAVPAITAETPEQVINRIMSSPNINEKLKGLYSLVQQAQEKEFDDATNVAFATALVNAFNEAETTQTYLGQILPAATRTPLLNEQQQEYVKNNMLAAPGLSPLVTQAAAATGLVPQEQVPTVAGELPMVPTEPVPAPTVPVKLPEIPKEKIKKKKGKKGKKGKKDKKDKKDKKKKVSKKDAKAELSASPKKAGKKAAAKKDGVAQKHSTATKQTKAHRKKGHQKKTEAKKAHVTKTNVPLT